MSEKVLDFYLTHLFMLQGWDRSIDKVVLYKLLPFVQASNSDKKIIVITPSFYKSKGVIGRPNHCLVLVLRQNLIKTGYWCDHPNYLFRK
jgi:hypothetical protein